jgi:dihydroceramidase
MQLLDELSMIYTTCVMFYAIFAHKRSILNAVLTGLFTTFIAVFITGYYYYIKDPLFHQNAFALLTAIVFFRSLWGMEVTLRPSLRNKRPDFVPAKDKVEQARRDRRDLEILRTVWRRMIPIGMGSIALGFLIWNLDNIFCSTLREWRRQVGLPWGVFLEGHGWW